MNTEFEFKEHLGHSSDNATELIASVTDAAITFTDKFSNMIRGLEGSEKEAAIKSLRLSFDLIGNRHPSLKLHLADVESRILTAANA